MCATATQLASALKVRLETDNESEFWQWWASVVEWKFWRRESQGATVHVMVVGELGGAEPAQ